MTNSQADVQLVRELLEVILPGGAPATVAGAALGTQKTLGGLGIISPSHPDPPRTKAFDRKFRRIMGHPEVHDTLIPMNIVSPVGNRGPHRPTREVILVHLSRFAFRTHVCQGFSNSPTRSFFLVWIDRAGFPWWMKFRIRALIA